MVTNFTLDTSESSPPPHLTIIPSSIFIWRFLLLHLEVALATFGDCLHPVIAISLMPHKHRPILHMECIISLQTTVNCRYLFSCGTWYSQDHQPPCNLCMPFNHLSCTITSKFPLVDALWNNLLFFICRNTKHIPIIVMGRAIFHSGSLNWQV